jgi:branched-chain amino acid transport system substrate-binding protein
MTFPGMSQTRLQQPSLQLIEEGPVIIGLLLPDQTHSEVIEAAKLAIQKANAEGGYHSRQFSLVIRTAQGFWGAGSKESVKLVYEDNVCAIIGSLDGRNGHLAEQVAAKSHLAYIEAFATEPTLSQAFVPWFMRVVPNDNQQSVAILDLITKEGGGKIAILSSDNYDTRYAVRSLTKEVARMNGMAPLVLDLDASVIDQKKVAERIIQSGIEHLIVPFDADYMKELIVSVRALYPKLKIYGTLHFTMGVESRNSGWDSYEGVYMVSPDLLRETSAPSKSIRSAYLYDAFSLVIDAVRQVGPDRQAITTRISRSEYPKGTTGSISFDELGNRQILPSLILIKNGAPGSISSFRP